MKPFRMWVIVDKRGAVWRYTNGEPCVWARREDAAYDAVSLDTKRGWHPLKVTVSAADRKGEHRAD